MAKLTKTNNAQKTLAEFIFQPDRAAAVFCVTIGCVYGIVPAILYTTILPEQSYAQLSSLTLFALIALWIGFKIPAFDGRFRRGAPCLEVDASMLVITTWLIFGLFVLVTFATAPSIPILSAIGGVDPNILSQERGDFLKGRQGAGLALLYLSTLLSTTAVPYTIILLYAAHHRARHILAALFFLFCISFVQKALFLNLVLPMLAFFAKERKLGRGRAALWAGGSAAFLLLLTIISTDSTSNATTDIFETADIFTANFLPTSSMGYFIWRALAVPIFTATDTLTVHQESFGGQPLLGATSSLLAALFGQERVNLERYVFEYQFGGWNDIANANAVWVTDAYVNFGWPGVGGFGLVIGQIFRWFRLSPDIAFRSIWPVFAFGLFSASLIGMMLSNGFLFMLLFALFVRIRNGSLGLTVPSVAPTAVPKPRP